MRRRGSGPGGPATPSPRGAWGVWNTSAFSANGVTHLVLIKDSAKSQSLPRSVSSPRASEGASGEKRWEDGQRDWPRESLAGEGGGSRALAWESRKGDRRGRLPSATALWQGQRWARGMESCFWWGECAGPQAFVTRSHRRQEQHRARGRWSGGHNNLSNMPSGRAGSDGGLEGKGDSS